MWTCYTFTEDSHNTGNFMPYSFRIMCGFFNVPQNCEQSRVVRRGLRFIAVIREHAGLGLKGSNYGASSSDNYKDKLKKLVCYSVAGHFAPCRARPFQSIRFELDKGETTLVLFKKTRHQKSNQMNNLAQRIPSVFYTTQQLLTNTYR